MNTFTDTNAMVERACALRENRTYSSEDTWHVRRLDLDDAKLLDRLFASGCADVDLLVVEERDTVAAIRWRETHRGWVELSFSNRSGTFIRSDSHDTNFYVVGEAFWRAVERGLLRIDTFHRCQGNASLALECENGTCGPREAFEALLRFFDAEQARRHVDLEWE